MTKELNSVPGKASHTQDAFRIACTYQNKGHSPPQPGLNFDSSRSATTAAQVDAPERLIKAQQGWVLGRIHMYIHARPAVPWQAIVAVANNLSCVV